MKRRLAMVERIAALMAAGTLVTAAVSAQTAQRPQRAVPVAATKTGAAQAPRFDVNMLWPRPMPNRWIEGSSVGVAVDARDHVFVLNIGDAFNSRTEIGAAPPPGVAVTGECCVPAPSVLEFDQSGALIGHWGGPGAGYTWPEKPSGLAIDKEGNVWIGGSGPNDTQVLKFTHDGTFLMAAGKIVPAPAMPAPAAAAPDTAYQGMSGAARGAAGGRGGRAGGRGRGRGRAEPPPTPPNSSSTESFAGATRISFDEGAHEAFVADGSRNRRVAVIDMTTGAIKRFWGAYGNKPDDAPQPPYSPGATASQQFGTPVMCAAVSNDGFVYVCDRSNDRIQVFRKDGSFVKEGTVMPNTLREGSVSDIAFSRDPAQRFLYVADGMNDQVHVLDRATLAMVSSFGDGGRVPGEFFALHSIATDSKGDIFTTETLEGKRVQKFTYKGLGPAAAATRAVLWPTNGGKP